MGDGTIQNLHREYNPKLRVATMSKDYIRYLDNCVFGRLSTGVKIHNHEESGEIYAVDTVAHPELEQYAEWYDSGEKVWEEVNLNPTILKHLYVCDGGLTGSGVAIACENESDKTEKLLRMFEPLPIPQPTVRDYSTYRLEWGADGAREFLHYIGPPVPGFKYKWDVY